MTKKINDFENNLLRLEEISKDISKDNITLEEASKLYEEGVKISNLCKKYLDEKELIIDNITQE